ncbi:unnamed protein product [Amoebophrya sp. A25]|nr:unnamed protein product [Amoebophrya sp. A25]|eukprot:GSA25T00011625001.1
MVDVSLGGAAGAAAFIDTSASTTMDLGEQWLKHGNLVMRYVKKLRNERDWVCERLLVLQENWAREKQELDIV